MQPSLANGYVTVTRRPAGSTQRDHCVHLPRLAPLPWPPTALPCPTTALEIAQLKIALTDCGAGTGVTGRHGNWQFASSYRQFARVMTPASRATSTQTGTSRGAASTYGSNGTGNACGTPTAGTFLLAAPSTLPTTSTVASGLTTALGMCAASTGVGFNTLSANTFNVADTVLGYATFTSPSGNLTLGAGSAGTNGSDVCSTTAGGNFAIGNSGAVPTTALSASNLRTAINGCPTGTGVSASYTSGSAFTATDTSILGNDTDFTVSGAQAGVFGWTGPTLGSNGSNSCTTPPVPPLRSPAPASCPPPRPSRHNGRR